MKKLENKTFIRIKNEDREPANYGDLLKKTLNIIKSRWLPAEIRAINKIYDVIDASNGEFQFEDEDAKFILKFINEYGLSVPGKEAEQFINDIEEMIKNKS